MRGWTGALETGAAGEGLAGFVGEGPCHVQNEMGRPGKTKNQPSEAQILQMRWARVFCFHVQCTSQYLNRD